MANYKCRAYGDCHYADSGEVFVRAPGDDLRCPGGCDTTLELDRGTKPPPGDESTRGQFPVAAVVAGVVLLLGGAGGGGYYYVTHHQPPPIHEVKQTPTTAVPATPTAPAPVVTASGPGGIAPSDAQIAELRNSSAARLTHGDAAGAEAASNDAAAKEMIKVAIADMQQGKLDDAEQALNNARARDSNQPLVYYNLSVLRLRQGRTDDALKELRTSFEYGFRAFDAMAKDPDFNGVRNDPRFVALLKQYHAATA